MSAWEVLLAIPFGLLIGMVVGTVGGGGAILALPVLVYVLGQPVGPASTASLLVVAIAAGLGAGALARKGHVCWGLAAAFTPPAALGAILGTYANGQVSPKVLVLAFVPIMAVASAATWRRASKTGGDDALSACPPTDLPRVLLAGAGVGLLTGFFGVGGGFVIVPVLTIAFGVCLRRAVATSLVIITITGLVALASHLVASTDLDVPVTASLALATGVGALLGTRVGGRLPQATLGRAFAVVVGLMALFLLVDVLLLGGPPQA